MTSSEFSHLCDIVIQRSQSSDPGGASAGTSSAAAFREVFGVAQ
jgi:hypothetical protein